MALFVGRLAEDTAPRDLEDLFASFGKIIRCDVKRPRGSSSHCDRTNNIVAPGQQPYGFVEFEDRRDAEDALYERNGAELLGSRISVEWARGPRGSRGLSPFQNYFLFAR